MTDPESRMARMEERMDSLHHSNSDDHARIWDAVQDIRHDIKELSRNLYIAMGTMTVLVTAVLLLVGKHFNIGN